MAQVGGRIDVKQNKRGRWYWKRISRNGQMAGSSLPDTYGRASDARRAARREYPDANLPIKTVRQ